MTELQMPPDIVIPRALSTVEAVWDETLDPPRAPGGGGGGGKPESKSPLPDGAFEVRREAAAVVGSWCSLVVTEKGLCTSAHDGPRHPVGQRLCLRRSDPLGTEVVDQAQWLTRHAAWLAEHELGPVAALELDEQAKGLDRVAHPDRPDSLYIGQCPVQFVPGGPSCGRRLYWPSGAERMRCPSCTVEDDVDGWLRRMGDDLPDQLTAVQLATFLTRRLRREISHDLVRKWVSKGVLVQVGRDERRRPLYAALASVVAVEDQIDRSQRPPRRVARAS